MEELPRSLHFIGVGGIGMSARAQMAACLGCETSGSDRALLSPENRRIMDSLRSKGVRLYAQDGSRFGEGEELPEALVCSTAIEKDNPDLRNAPAGIPRLHRSEALRLLVQRCAAPVFAVTGSCGKTTVSAWLAESLDHLGVSVSLLSGGLAKHFIRDGFAGNYAPGKDLCVLEADESDKSLLNYTADHAMILNIGTDHYSKEELAEVFRRFLLQTRISAVLEDRVLDAVGTECVKHLRIALFSTDPSSPAVRDGYPVFRVTGYRSGRDGVRAQINGREVRLPQPGLHNAANAAAVLAGLSLLGMDPEKARSAVEGFSGVWRRFDFAGRTAGGAAVYDDYAHNVEKICSCVEAVHEVCPGRVVFLFQPHGYGPFGFMRPELYPALEKVLGKEDVFAFLPVYYAGGTTSFQPRSEEVAAEYSERHPGGRYRCFSNRSEAAEFLKNLGEADGVVVMGARDNSLSDWAGELAEHHSSDQKKGESR